MNSVTVIVPIFNEESKLPELLHELKKKLAVDKDLKILIVNDGSTDSSRSILGSQSEVQWLDLETNLGKGRAVIQGIRAVNTSHVLIFDGDLEYDHNIIGKIVSLAKHLKENELIFASRYLNKSVVKLIGLRRQTISSILMNKILVIMYFILLKTKISDTLTGVKLYPVNFFNEHDFTRFGFDGDHEIAVKLLKSGFKIQEIEIAYEARTRAAGKKIRAKDGFLAIKTLILEVWRIKSE